MNQEHNYAIVAEIVADVLEANESDRAGVIDQLCADDEPLKARVLELLAAETALSTKHLFDDSRIDRQRKDAERLLDEAPAGPRSIGKYRVIRELGRGGMGVVYECEQPSPKRRVALKVIDTIRYSQALSRRFVAEAHLQGRLQHPAIVQVFDAGAAEVAGADRPYFVMELIEGMPLRLYADIHELSIPDRLALVARVADGIAHAHERQTVHRDLKHENILITQTGQPKILDFGIARFTGDASIGAMTITNEGQILGTIGYMAPEQLDGEPGSIGPTADVYAMGVILYELVAGVPPHNLAGLSIGAAVRVLDQQTPSPLRVACEGISRDIDTLVSKCLERDPQRRYHDAGTLAADLRRILASQPILARPPTKPYRAMMFAKRNKALVGGTAATVATLTIGIIAAALLGIGQHRARLDAERERALARQSELDAIRGVIVGSAALAQGGDIWQATEQLYAIDRASRGWEWHHSAIALPWLIERFEQLPVTDKPIDPTFVAWVSNHEAFYVSHSDNTPLLLDTLTGSWQRVPTDTSLLLGTSITGGGPPRSVAVADRNGNVGWLNVDDGAFIPGGLTIPPDKVSPDQRTAIAKVILGDASTVVSLFGKRCRVQGRGFEDLMFGDETPDDPHAGPWWDIAQQPADSPFLVLGRWGFPSLPAHLFCIDRRTGETVGSTPASYDLPGVVMDADGVSIYTRSDTGFDILAVPSLDRIESIELLGSALNLAPSPRGGVAFVPFGTDVLHFYAPDGTLTAWPESIGNQSFPNSPQFAPDGRLLLGLTPGENLPWVIDSGNPIEPQLRTVTTFEGHDTWVYQIAVSLDGSLLASAAPHGDVIIWDLTTGRQLHRIARELNESANFSAHRQDAPLVFSDDNDTLYLGGFDLEANCPGFVSLDLRDGSQAWTPAENRSDLNRKLARLLGDKTRALYHHASLLPDQRIIASTSSYYFSQRVAVLDQDSSDEIELVSTAAEITGGVAVSPDGKHFVSSGPYSVTVRNAQTLEVTRELPNLVASKTFGAAYSPDGTRLAIGTRAGQVLIYETNYYKRIATIDVPRVASNRWAAADPETRSYIYSLAWTPDGTRLICAGGSGVRVLESERPIVREKKAAAWNADLEAARSGLAASAAVKRIVAIEHWGNGSDSQDTAKNQEARRSSERASSDDDA
ncbi:MAG: protein kinase [Phycisphaerales bacterium]